MQIKTTQEEGFLKDIRDFFKLEIIENKTTEEIAMPEFLSICSTWEDNKSVEEQIRDVYSSRTSTNRLEKVF